MDFRDPDHVKIVLNIITFTKNEKIRVLESCSFFMDFGSKIVHALRPLNFGVVEMTAGDVGSG